MKRILVSTLITLLVSNFSILSPSYAQTNKTEETIKMNFINNAQLDRFSITESNLVDNRGNDSFNPFIMNFIIPGFTQFYYEDTKKGSMFLFGFVGALIIPASIRSYSRSYSELFMLFILEVTLAPIIYIWSLVDANYMVMEKRSLPKTSLRKEDLFSISLFSKEF